MSRCEYCPAGWEDRGYEGECNSYGCRILGYEMCDDNCRLSKATIDKRLKELEAYEAGEIKRPQWVANRFLRELDASCFFDGKPSHVSYPPVWMSEGVYYSIYGSVDLHYQSIGYYREGYIDGKEGKEAKY